MKSKLMIPLWTAISGWKTFKKAHPTDSYLELKAQLKMARLSVCLTSRSKTLLGLFFFYPSDS